MEDRNPSICNNDLRDLEPSKLRGEYLFFSPALGFQKGAGIFHGELLVLNLLAQIL
jgi:hypothetical protein